MWNVYLENSQRLDTLGDLADFKSLFQMHPSDSAYLEHTKQAAGGAGVPVGGLIVPYGIF